jgi:hypothetical protein
MNPRIRSADNGSQCVAFVRASRLYDARERRRTLSFYRFRTWGYLLADDAREGSA